jgi:hypothetical protein
MYIYTQTKNTTPPVYKIKGRFYNVVTLKLEYDNDWEDHSLFRIPFSLQHNWVYNPILAVTDYGSFILSSTDEGKYTLHGCSSKRAYNSPIKRIYLLNIPVSEDIIVYKTLEQPIQSFLDLLSILMKYELSFNEYTGHIPIRETNLKIGIKTLGFYLEKEWIVDIRRLILFDNPQVYNLANVILLIKLKGEISYVAVIGYIDDTYDKPIKMNIENILF